MTEKKEHSTSDEKKLDELTKEEFQELSTILSKEFHERVRKKAGIRKRFRAWAFADSKRPVWMMSLQTATVLFLIVFCAFLFISKRTVQKDLYHSKKIILANKKELQKSDNLLLQFKTQKKTFVKTLSNCRKQLSNLRKRIEEQQDPKSVKPLSRQKIDPKIRQELLDALGRCRKSQILQDFRFQTLRQRLQTQSKMLIRCLQKKQSSTRPTTQPMKR